MFTITFDRSASYIMWGWLGMYTERHFCEACGRRVRPKNVGIFKKLDDGSTGVWHDSLPCILAFCNINEISNTSAIKPRNSEIDDAV